MARSRTAMNLERDDQPIRGAALSPLRVVRRELVSPSGRVVVVDVPVYPPFRLPNEDERKLAQAAQPNGHANGTDGESPTGDRAGDRADDRADDSPDQADADSAS